MNFRLCNSTQPYRRYYFDFDDEKFQRQSSCGEANSSHNWFTRIAFMHLSCEKLWLSITLSSNHVGPVDFGTTVEEPRPRLYS